MKTKKCSTCKKVKPISKFYKNKAKYDGLSNNCKDCSNEYSKNWREKNPDYHKEYNKF